MLSFPVGHVPQQNEGHAQFSQPATDCKAVYRVGKYAGLLMIGPSPHSSQNILHRPKMYCYTDILLHCCFFPTFFVDLLDMWQSLLLSVDRVYVMWQHCLWPSTTRLIDMWQSLLLSVDRVYVMWQHCLWPSTTRLLPLLLTPLSTASRDCCLLQ